MNKLKNYKDFGLTLEDEYKDIFMNEELEFQSYCETFEGTKPDKDKNYTVNVTNKEHLKTIGQIAISAIQSYIAIEGDGCDFYFDETEGETLLNNKKISEQYAQDLLNVTSNILDACVRIIFDSNFDKNNLNKIEAMVAKVKDNTSQETYYEDETMFSTKNVKQVYKNQLETLEYISNNFTPGTIKEGTIANL